MSKEELKDKDLELEVRPKAEDELIHAPKGTSKGRFLLGFVLALLTLGTFSISGEIIDLFSCGPTGRGAFMTWNHPKLGVQEVKGADFVLVQRNYAKVLDILTGNSSRKDNEDDVAELILFDALAQNAGIGFTDKELGEFLAPRVGSQELYLQRTRRYGISPKDFEAMLRRILRADRYRSLIGSSLVAPDPAEVEKLWKGRHQEYAFEYVELATDKLAEEARALAPVGEELKKWFDALSEPEKGKYKTQEMARAHVVYKTLGPETKAEDLLAKYPPAAGDAEVVAKTYYDSFYYVRFPNPDFKPDPKNFDPSQFYLPFERVKDQCLVEAPIYNAVEAWITDMVTREGKGEAVDLLVEGQSYRFGFRNTPDPTSRADFSNEALEGYGRYVADVIFDPQLKPGTINAHAVITKNAIVVVKLLERQEARMPEFPEIEARVKEEWVKKKQGELAVARLEALRDKFGTRPADTEAGASLWAPEADAEAFAKVVREAGFEVQRRDWQERFVPTKAGETPTPTQTFFQQAAPLYTKKEGSVVKAETARDGANAYLVRVAGVRDADVAKMTPPEFQSLSQQATQASIMEFHTRITSREFLEKNFGLHLRSWDKQDEPAAP